MDNANAFEIFPLEVWEVILDKVDDPKDVVNTFEAYPELETAGLLKREKHLWLFNQVAPFIFPYISQKDLLSCRQVSKMWFNGTNDFLDNHPTRRPIVPDTPSAEAGLRWTSDTTKGNYHLWKPIPETKPFLSSEMFDEFLQSIGEHPTRMNPFLGRAVTISDYNMRDEVQRTAFWNRALEFLREFGTHIWFLRIKYKCVSDHLRLFELVRETLDLVPNLKGFRINNEFQRNLGLSEFQRFLELNKPLIPSLPQLETLELDVHEISPGIAWFLLTNYSTNIKKLAINHRFWNQEYCDSFPNLVEFSVTGVSKKQGATDLFLALNAPKLCKMELGLTSHVIDIGSDLIPWLKRFPKITLLKMNCQKYVFSDDKTAELSTIPSLKSLFLEGEIQERDEKFFSCFPNLEYIRIFYMNVMYRERLGSKDKYATQIFELLPSLREMILSSWHHRSVHTSREGYKNWKKGRSVN